MEKKMPDKEKVLQLAVQRLNDMKYPFTVTVDGNQLIAVWKWKDTTVLGSSMIAKENSSFRYIIRLRDDGTFYGFDADEETLFRGGADGKIYGGGKRFTGQEIRFHKEISLSKKNGKMGLHTYGFSTREIHEPIIAFFETQGWRYREPAVWGVRVSKTSKKTFLFIGILFVLIGGAGIINFWTYHVGVIVFIPLFFLATGIWALLTGGGMIPLPVFSKTFGVTVIFAGIFLSFTIVFGITEYITAKYAPEIFNENQSLKTIFHLVEILGSIAGIATFFVYMITACKHGKDTINGKG